MTARGPRRRDPPDPGPRPLDRAHVRPRVHRRDRSRPDVRRELTQRCDADGGALFTLAPPATDVLTRLADAGEVMPPKTTYFEPKPCAGIFLRP